MTDLPPEPQHEERRAVPSWEHAAEARRATRREKVGRPRRDSDVGKRAQTLRMVTWSFLGGILGGLMGVLGMNTGRWGPEMVAVLFVVGWLFSFALPLLITAGAGQYAGTLFAPSGRSTPRKRGYSMAESLAARGLYEESIAAFKEAIAEDPSDPIPYLKIARLYRDKLRRYEDSASWFRKILRESSISEDSSRLARHELVELYVSKLGEPKKAIPVLSRAAEELAGTDEGDWAARELQEIRELAMGETDAG